MKTVDAGFTEPFGCPSRGSRCGSRERGAHLPDDPSDARNANGIRKPAIDRPAHDAHVVGGPVRGFEGSSLDDSLE